ncbi:MAG: PepSY domain-containing protein [Burkholderiaceae bacterium]|nr:PepSY domain-containing protein [Burkholderiaceae bacterium]
MRIYCVLRRGLLALSVGLAAAPVFADDCDAPVQQWQSREDLRRMAAARGWEVERVKIDDGCYEIRGTDANGLDFKAKVDPETLEVVKFKQRDRERDRARDRGRTAAQRAPSDSHGRTE